jgi:hypothetical protein
LVLLVVPKPMLNMRFNCVSADTDHSLPCSPDTL